MNPTVDRYAVIGNPVAHSRSPEIHAAFAAQTGQALVYERLSAETDAFVATVDRFFDEGGAGLNVTLPFKHEAAAYADSLSQRAERAGAVNTLKHDGNDRVFGDNTDGIGLLRDLTDHFGVAIRDARILILGAGGAVRGVVPVLLEKDPATLCIANRSPDRAERIARDFADLGPIEACALADIRPGWDLMINAISAGLSGTMPDLPDTAGQGVGAAYDMIYADAPTPFMRWATARGIPRRRDGFGMLVEQAAESFHLWRGVRPRTAAVIDALRPGAQAAP